MRCPLWPCDTEHAINPAIWRVEASHETAETLMEKVAFEGPWDLCLTGGEPFMQKDVELQEFVELAREDGRRIEVFTNGSFEFPRWSLTSMQFIMDWKLKGSGEADTMRHVRHANAMKLKHQDSIKFVCTSMEDLEEALAVWSDLRLNCDAQFWAGAAWDKLDPKVVIDFITVHELPWKLNIQVHKYIWPADMRGV